VNPVLSRTLGSRHRAAIGLSEDTDTVAVVVSEETGAISLVEAGQIRRGLDGPALRRALLLALGLGGSRPAEGKSAPAPTGGES
jgi:diadenylate cyclase